MSTTKHLRANKIGGVSLPSIPWVSSYRFFWNLHHEFFDYKKNHFENNFVMSKISLRVVQPKENKNTIIIIKGSTGSSESFFSIQYTLANVNLYSKFSLLRWFLVPSLYYSSLNFQIDYIVKNKKMPSRQIPPVLLETRKKNLKISVGNFLWLVSLKITQKTENNIVGLYRFG